jgi:6-phosphogluconolactonase
VRSAKPIRYSEVITTDDPSTEAADRIAAVVRSGGHIALSGGSTPRAAYERLAALDLDWPRATLWFGDDRCVPPEDERSNYRLLREAILDRLVGPPPVVRRIQGELGPWEAADLYERELRAELPQGMPQLDLVLLGIGPDAHCASLFPNQKSLEERERAVVGVEEAGMQPFGPRVTLTLPAINAAREVVFLAAGEDKAEAVARAFAGPDPAAPASLVAPAPGSLTWLLDPAAAAKLER